ncbi:retropepsin-like aspartic protease [Roseivirga sp. BDSF3-8]|uniref:retropepsin-like aspartic protease n=1 Tax=Roseivirga sp. BDSF3-8 TaxID=3241598 RepID=UPI003531C22C
MKKVVVICLLLMPVLSYAQQAQEDDLIRQRLEALFAHIATNHFDSLQPYLAEELTVSGHAEPTATAILKALPMQASAPDSYEIADRTHTGAGLVVAVIAMVKGEQKEYTFSFNEKYFFTEINMFKVEVQQVEEPKATPLPKPVVIPFTLVDGLIFIKVKLGQTKDPLNFVFDTGATTCVLDSLVARQYDMTEMGQQSGKGAHGSSTYSLTSLDTLLVNEISLSNVTTVLVDLDHLGGAYRIDGIIGHTLLSKYPVKIDYDRAQLTLYNDMAQVTRLYHRELTFSFKDGIQIPKLPMTIRLASGQSYAGDVFMDTGAGPAFLLNSSYVKAHSLNKEFRERFFVGFRSLTKGPRSGDFKSTIPALQLGAHRLEEIPIIVTASEQGINALPNTLGIAGSGILHRFNWLLDYNGMKAYYEPNSYYDKPFLYPATNFTIRRKAGKMYLNNVQPGSEEAEQGLVNDLEVISVNGLGYEEYDQIEELIATDGITIELQYINSGGQKEVMKIRTGRKI